MSTSETNSVRKYDRPDGMTIEPYRTALKWGNKRWAWEFLRRNEAFKKETLAVRERLAEQQAVAAKFGLKKFKGYWEDYNHVENGKPRFRQFVEPRMDIVGGDAGRKVSLNLAPGQLALVVSVEDLKSKAAVREVLKRADKILSKRARGAARHKTSDLIEMLRILDALDAGQEPAAMAKAIYPRETEGKSKEECRVHMKDRSARARAFANEHYLDIAHRKTRVNVEASKAFTDVILPRKSAGKPKGRP